MKSTIVFRALFQQPKNTTYKLSAHIAVEVYHSKVGPPGEWAARVPGSKLPFKDVTPQSTSRTLMGQIETVHFERHVSPWEAFDLSKSPARLLESEDWSTDAKGAVYTTERYRAKLEAEHAKEAEQSEAQRKADSERRISEMKAKALEGR